MTLHITRSQEAKRGCKGLYHLTGVWGCAPASHLLAAAGGAFSLEGGQQGFPILAKKGLQRAASPLPEREVSSHSPLLPAAAGGKKENRKAMRRPKQKLTTYAMILSDDNRVSGTKDKQLMLSCERCGHDIPENVAICPSCGTVTLKAKDNPPPATSYGAYSEKFSSPSTGNADNRMRDYPTPQAQDYRTQQQSYSYGQSYNAPPMFQQAPLNVTVIHTNNSTPLIVELLLSIFLGIFGVGWLIAGDVFIGIVLLVCSLFIYLPLLIISIFIAFFTFGLSLLCTGPMIIGAIALNAILLNNRLKHKSASYMPIPPL